MIYLLLLIVFIRCQTFLDMLLFRKPKPEVDSDLRQSFSERICDDLSQVLLQYLPLKDKIRLQCVSKQFQRTIFLRHFVIEFTEYDTEYWFEGLPLVNDISFRFVVKKCS